LEKGEKGTPKVFPYVFPVKTTHTGGRGNSGMRKRKERSVKYENTPTKVRGEIEDS